MKTVVLTSDKHNWLLKGFLHQWQKYAVDLRGQKPGILQVTAVGFTPPAFIQQFPFADFHSIGAFADYPVNRWSDALIRYLTYLEDDLVLVLLEDYWLTRMIDMTGLQMAWRYMVDHKDVARFDVASDRMFAHEAYELGGMAWYDLVEAKGAYSLSLQASIFRRELLLKLLVPGENPWQTELNGTGRLNQLPYRVVGTRQWPIRYSIVVNKGEFDRKGQWMFPPRTLSAEDWEELDKLGYTTQGE